MFLENFILIILYCIIIVSALLVIFSENSVYSVFFLILTFCNVILLLLVLGAEFLAFLLLIVYVGAIAVLFLFVVMMLNIKSNLSNSLNFFFLYSLPILFLLILFILDYFWNFYTFFDILKTLNLNLTFTNWIDNLFFISNIETIGNVFYTNYCFLFIVSGLILLVAMIGVIVLTVHQKTIFLLKKQNINYQLVQNSKTLIKFVTIRK
uniref:NADH dehydrogenase subunit 6 n=1 Tax=Herposiphonia versicolor TaxID=2007163 RepID=UPI0022FD5CB2|nr:NADH dehydrogenase subunit 6 [Herposiphonia versicolor]WAX04186.1 NADH dehydrogenase subunit 6 [Herposiphonia versicolor]